MENKTATLQRDVINNTEDLQFFLRDLNQWETQIKKKDLELRQLNEKKENKVIPKIRNLAEPVVKSDKPEKTKHKKKPARIPSSDYKSWEKFDVNAACKQVEEESSSSEEESSSSDDEMEEDEELELNRRRQHAILEKDKGNEFLKVGKINEALECYTRGCNLDPENALLPANRALALIKTQQYAAAERDCDTALELDPTYVKAYQRRAVAREALGKYQNATEDLKDVLKFEPHNKDALNKLEKLKKLMVKKVEVSKALLEVDPDDDIVFPIDKPPHLKSSKPLQRIKIVESNVKTNEKKSSSKEDKSKESDTTTSVKVPKLEPVKSSQNISLPSLPNPPTSFYRLQSDFAQLKSYPELQYQYLKSIPCNQFASLFRENLEPDILSTIIELLCEYYIKNCDNVYEPLRQLVLTKRFSTLKLFFSQKEKDMLRKLFDYIKSQEGFPEYDVVDLMNAYGL